MLSEISQFAEGHLGHGSSYIRYLESSDSLTETVDCRGRDGALLFNETESVLQNEKKSGDGLWRRSHSSVRILNATDLYAWNGQDGGSQLFPSLFLVLTSLVESCRVEIL